MAGRIKPSSLCWVHSSSLSPTPRGNSGAPASCWAGAVPCKPRSAGGQGESGAGSGDLPASPPDPALPGHAWQGKNLDNDEAGPQPPPSQPLFLEPCYNHTSSERRDSTTICLQDLFLSCKNQFPLEELVNCVHSYCVQLGSCAKWGWVGKGADRDVQNLAVWLRVPAYACRTIAPILEMRKLRPRE